MKLSGEGFDTLGGRPPAEIPVVNPAADAVWLGLP